MTRRGITLVEALVALFVAALGMISLLTLFPLGMLQMGQALKDGRCTSAASEADTLLRWYWRKFESTPGWNSPIYMALDRGRFPPLGTTTPLPNPNWADPRDPRPSFPVLIDPIGAATVWPFPDQLGAVSRLLNVPRETVYEPIPSGNTLVPQPLLRVLPSDPPPLPALPGNPSKPKILRFCLFQDDLEYVENTGVPSMNPASQPVERGGRYSWAWLVQRPNNTHRTLLNVQVVVFDDRAPFFARQETSLVQGTESVYAVTFVPGSTAIAVNYGARVRPAIVRGRWILDATHYADAPANTQPLRHAKFYRVMSVNADTPGVLYLELETPIRRSDGQTIPYAGEMVVMNGVTEIFDRPPLAVGD